MTKRLLISVLSLIFCTTMCVAQKMTVTVDSVGKLSEQLPDSIRYTIEDLKVCGPLNGSEIGRAHV